MNLRQIEIFHAVYSYGSVSAAARALNVSQPSVTNTLRHAELVIGFLLFRRVKGRLIPTEDAHSLFDEVGEIHQRVQALRRAGQNIRHAHSGLLRVATLPSLGLEVVADAVADFRRTHPGVVFDLEIVHHEDMVRRLYEREADVVIGNQVPRSMPVAHQRLGAGALGVLFRDGDLPAAPGPLPLAALGGLPFVAPQSGSAFGRLLESELRRLGVELDEVMSARTFYIAAALVRAGVGVAVVDSFTALALLRPGLCYRSLEPALTFDVHAIYLESRPPTTIVAAFLASLTRAIAAL